MRLGSCTLPTFMGLATADADRPPTAAATSKMVLSCVTVFSV
jgi:hypothetical protein